MSGIKKDIVHVLIITSLILIFGGSLLSGPVIEVTTLNNSLSEPLTPEEIVEYENNFTEYDGISEFDQVNIIEEHKISNFSNSEQEKLLRVATNETEYVYSRNYPENTFKLTTNNSTSYYLRGERVSMEPTYLSLFGLFLLGYAMIIYIRIDDGIDEIEEYNNNTNNKTTKNDTNTIYESQEDDAEWKYVINDES